jgi:hypothetical protein
VGGLPANRSFRALARAVEGLGRETDTSGLLTTLEGVLEVEEPALGVVIKGMFYPFWSLLDLSYALLRFRGIWICKKVRYLQSIYVLFYGFYIWAWFYHENLAF